MSDWAESQLARAWAPRDAAVEVVAAALVIDYAEVLGGLDCARAEQAVTPADHDEINLVIGQVERLRKACAALVLARDA
jgi:hypothetical protein